MMDLDEEIAELEAHQPDDSAPPAHVDGFDVASDDELSPEALRHIDAETPPDEPDVLGDEW